MVDTERFQLGPGLIQVVAQVATRLAERTDQTVNPIQVATYVPLDVDSVGRILESLEEDYDLERVERDSICLFRFRDAQELEEATAAPVDIDNGEHLIDNPLFESNLADLKSEDGWTRKVREQHEILSVAAAAGTQTVELSHFISRSDLPSSKVQSILNDFGAERYVGSHIDEEAETVSYTFPEFDYPEHRRDRNLEIVEELDGQSRSPRVIWYLLGVSVVLLLVIVILVRFYT